MQIKYRFTINNHKVNPIYNKDLAKEYEKEGDHQFFRAKLNGKLIFVRNDFQWIVNQDFDEEMILRIEKSINSGETWVDYFQGVFYKTDCEFDLDSERVEVQVSTFDQYAEILAGLEKEYDLLKLSPARQVLKLDKRPLIQVYFLGDPIVSCFLGGAYWEQEVEKVIDNHSEMAQYHFNRTQSADLTLVSGSGTHNGDSVSGEYVREGSSNRWTSTSGLFELREESVFLPDDPNDPGGQGTYVNYYMIVNLPQRITIFEPDNYWASELEAVPGTNSYGSVSVTHGGGRSIYMRYVTDSNAILGTNTYPIPPEDMVGNNRNYKRTIGIGESLGRQMVVVESALSTTPTEYGMAPGGMYYRPPYSLFGDKFYPIGKSTWGVVSVWFSFHHFDFIAEESGRVPYTIRDAISISDVIKVLVRKIDPNITHEENPLHSEFLYGGNNPITYGQFRILLTQKSNILSVNYDKPAERAPITLSVILGMLEKTMQLYWFIDEQNRFRVEHISWFRNGGSYGWIPDISYDLTQLIQSKNNKPWGFASSKFSYEKSDLAERYEFDWMDEVSDAFIGYPIEVNSKYVQRGKIEEISVSSFSTDVDYLLLNPNSASPEGFVLFGAVWNNSENRYELPYIERQVDGAELRLQNGLMSFVYLHPNFWVHNLPSWKVTINNSEDIYVQGVERTKKQEVTFPSVDDPETLKLIKTALGSGQIEKLSVSLSSRMNKIELRYDTE